MSDERIKAAANELSLALTEGGENYTVQVQTIERTCIEDSERKYAHTVFVTRERFERIAP